MPEVRGRDQKVDMGFTEKKFPHLPARESHLKEPPYPKSKKLDNSRDNNNFIDVEDTDPVWLKDKGDHFFKRFDYNAAINAYTKAIKADPQFLAGRLNRAAAFIKVRGFVACADDCSDIVEQIGKLKQAEYEDDKQFYDKIMVRALVKRAAANSWMSDFDTAIEDFEKILASDTYKEIVGKKDIENIEKDLGLIRKRKESQHLKYKGDAFFYQEKMDDALKEYLSALETDKENEYALGNIGLVYMLKSDHEKCIEYSTKALQTIDRFQNETKLFSK